MTRDAAERLFMFVALDYMRAQPVTIGADLWEEAARYVTRHLKVVRIALTMDQVRQYNPPPNPAKITDSRSGSYISRFGDKSWELDALDPPILQQLVRDNVETLIDDAVWDADIKREREGQKRLRQLSEMWPLMDNHWAQVAQYINSLNGTAGPESKGDDDDDDQWGDWEVVDDE
jgi:hypothetical protein